MLRARRDPRDAADLTYVGRTDKAVYECSPFRLTRRGCFLAIKDGDLHVFFFKKKSQHVSVFSISSKRSIAMCQSFRHST
eukprot:SAG11_NODE_15830_length_565_cov_0.974249_2_plen_79_part_01